MDAKKLLEAVGELSEAKSITPEAVVNALKESLIRAYTKFLGGGDDADVRCEINPEKGTIELGQMKTVVDEVTDDYLQIETSEANAGLKKAKYKEGDSYFVECSIEDLKKATALAVKSNLRMKLGEAERTALYEIYKDHIGEMITGKVEKADERSVTVNIGRTNVELSRKEMIGDESFRVGDPIKVYIEEVRSNTKPTEPGVVEKKRGPQIQVTRSSEGFLKRLFEEEIHEVFDGTVIIKGIARYAGVRSKIAVTSNNPDVDPTGACIGPSGSRIQRIVSQLGNGKDKEKIDIISYSDNKGLYIIEALRPAQVVGVKLFDAEENAAPRAIAVIKDQTMSLAIGRKMANLKLANKITGYDIQLMEEAAATAENIDFVPSSEWIKQAEAEKAIKEKEAYFNKSKEDALKRAEEFEALKKTEAPKTGAGSEEFPEEASNPALAALEAFKAEEAERKAKEARAAERKAFSIPTVEETKVEEKQVENDQPTNVTTTTTLDALEKELVVAKEKKTNSVKNKRPRNITEEEVSHVSSNEPVTPKAVKDALSIYTQEELDEMEKEDAAEEFDESNLDEEVDYEDYDQYYDEGK